MLRTLVLLAVAGQAVSIPGRVPVLVPRAGQALHCGGQSSDAFSNYSSFMVQGAAAPGCFMTYVSLATLKRSWFADLQRELQQVSPGAYVVPQIGLNLPHGNELAGVGNGTYDAQIAELVAGLSLLNRPAYVRVGYEFNGQWNNYPPAAYLSAWERVVGAWRADAALASTTAAVWDYSCDAAPGRLNWTSYLPQGTAHQPDWWGVNIFSGNSGPDSACVAQFVAAAEAAAMPVMLGESTPRGLNAADAPLATISSDMNTSNCIAVAGGSASGDGATIVTWECHENPDKLWRITMPEGFLVNHDGKCVALDAVAIAAGTSSGLAVAGECGGTDIGPKALRGWHATASGQLATDSGLCLVARSAARGSPLELHPCDDAASRAGGGLWTWTNSSAGGGDAAWNAWFDPYLKLIAQPTVQAFCYINWFWPRRSNHESFNWYDWGDARVEHTTIVGPKLRAALGSSASGIVNVQPTRTALCAELGCE